MFDSAQERYDDLRERFRSFESGDPPNGKNTGIDKTESMIALAAAIGATFLVRNALKASWRSAFDREPPQNPASSEVDWTDAIAWGAVSGALIGVARIASRRASSSAYRRFLP